VRGVLDTSVFIAREQDRPLQSDRLPDDVAAARKAGSRPKVQDTWIAATAHVHSAAVYTQDSDFDGLPDIEVVRV